jgi:hypothetical protein
MIDLKEFLSISGLSGIHKFHAKTKTGLIVESLLDGKKVQIFSTQKVSALEDISIFTTDEDMPLGKVFSNIYDKEKGGLAISHKSSANDLKAYFLEILPNFDEERVYISDIKKVVQWYNLLQEKNYLKFVEEASEETATAKEEKVEEVKAEEKKAEKAETPKKKSTKKTKE